MRPFGVATENEFRGTETVLIADDEHMLRGMLEEVLKASGYTVLVAKDGREAVAIYETHAAVIDLVILDILMPFLNGVEVHNEIKKLNPEALVMFMSAYAGEMLDMLPEPKFLEKPFGPTDLLREIRRLLPA
jgi:CheY-like chemotaxis protein